MPRAIERKGAAALGADAGLLAGVGASGIMISDDPLPATLAADGVVDFSAPAASVEMAALAAQARIAHVVGTTGLTEADLDKIAAAARHAPIVRSGNMSLGVNLLARLVRDAARALGPEYDVEIVEMHHRMKVDAPSGTALMLGEAAADGRGSNSRAIPSAAATASPARASRARSASPRCAAARWSAITA